ncbi:multidrug transporter [Sphingomonas spermidinifaciens]|uniref:Multidrug transporter n=1 Tax=Sphingomonas spermidinifaciens TaxID=1141889 RepID=A0A2A4B179_9SPHN|nr:SapC family protein [Sphingomonas spermidinifaciens]PCD01820.1 multidrug transporter [Sphingomonas spermidinifaciens]
MASAPQGQLPLFYNQLAALSSVDHAEFRVRPANTAPFLANHHAVPLTVEEFPLVQRRMPIVFSVGDDPVPLALMGLNEGVNTFLDADGKLLDEETYIPAYVRRYPYMLARLRPESEELSLCFDPTSDTIGAFEDGEKLFENGEPTELTRGILSFAEQFEQAGQRTSAFMAELKGQGLLMDGEISIQPEGAQPFVYRGFQMIDEAKLNDLRGDQLRKMQQNGMLPLIYAHLFSLSLMRDVFAKQMRQGKMPQQPVPLATN